jgi:hypothetical protein
MTISISHHEVLMHETRCPKGNEFLTWSNGLPKKISDRDLDNNGYYSFD